MNSLKPCVAALFCVLALSQIGVGAVFGDEAPTPDLANAVSNNAIKPRGPIAIRNARPFHLVFLQFAPQDAEVLERGQTRLGLQLDLINNLLQPATSANGAQVREDNEVQRLQISYRKGLGKRLEAAVVVPVLARNGGILDGPIKAYHRALGIRGDLQDNPDGRNTQPNGRSVLFYRTSSGQIVNASDAFGLGDVSLFLKRELLENQSATLALRAGLKAPTGSRSRYLGSGSFDAGLMLDARLVLARRVFLHAGAGVVAMGRANRLPGAERTMLQSTLGLEWSRKRDSILMQIDANSRAITTGNAFADRAPVAVSVGYKRDLKHGRMLTASFSENGDYHLYKAPLFGNVAPDLVLSFGLEWAR